MKLKHTPIFLILWKVPNLHRIGLMMETLYTIEIPDAVRYMKKSGVWEQIVGESHDLRHRSLINKSQSAPNGYFQIAEIRKARIKVEALMPIVNLPSVNKKLLTDQVLFHVYKRRNEPKVTPSTPEFVRADRPIAVTGCKELYIPHATQFTATQFTPNVRTDSCRETCRGSAYPS